MSRDYIGFNLRLPPELHSKLKILADERRYSLHSLIINILEDFLEKENLTNKPYMIAERKKTYVNLTGDDKYDTDDFTVELENLTEEDILILKRLGILRE